ncbi:Ig-like domain-containing protein [Methanobrevibacter sp.]|uniref:Ig-like domain-containing protein n=1 Tax=Methanobrevibacter sp. TaxID=66852 RepID=UPI0038908F1E
MFKKKFVILAIFLVSLMAVSAVSAADNATGDVVGVEGIADEAVGVGNDEEILEVNNLGTFIDLANEIANADIELNLNRNYTYCDDDSDYKNGIIINKSIVINGNGYAINGNDQARAFEITSSNVIFNNINFVNCRSSGNGGAISGNCSAVNCTFVNNSASYGGAMYDCSAVNCTFIGNSARHGAAMYNSFLYDGSAVNCIFVNNSASYGGAISGGNHGSAVNCTFIGNSAGEFGGAMYMYQGSAVNCTFVNNSAGSGGAMYGGSTVNCTFVSNSARGAGGAMRDGSAVNCTFVNNSAYNGGAVSGGSAVNCTFIGNSAGEFGGAMYIGSAVNCTFVNNSAYNGGAVSGGSAVNCTFVNNSASSGGATYNTAADTCNFVYNVAIMYGGAMYNGTAINSNFKRNHANQDGGAIYDTLVGNSLFEYNSAINGGAMCLGRVTNCTFNYNNATCYGGAVYNSKVSTSSRFSNNYAPNGNDTYNVTWLNAKSFVDLNKLINNNTQRDIFLDTNYTFDLLYDSSFIDGIVVNRTVTIHGEGYTIDGYNTAGIFNLYCMEDEGDVLFYDIVFVNGYTIESSGVIKGKCTVVNCTFVNNSASDGGAMYGGSAVNCSFINCSALGHFNEDYEAYEFGFGGAMYGGSAVNCTFVNNSAYNGGAMYGGSAVNCTFVNNSARGDGGAVSGGSAVNCTFVNNSAYNGGAMRDGSAVNCTFVNNSARGDGGAMYGGSAVNCTFVNNSAYDGGAVSGGSAVNCTFVSNSARGDGGAMYGGSAVNCTFVNNFAYNGGAVSGGSAVNCTFNYNKAGLNGGAMYDSSVVNCTFVNNSAGERGGAVYYCYKYYKSIDNSCFINCSAIDGGAIYIDNNSHDIWVINSRFVNCHAEECGGGIYFSKNCGLINSTFEGCVANNGSDWYSTYPLLEKIQTSISSNGVYCTYGSDEKLVATLKDRLNNLLVGEQISILLDNVEYTLKTDSNGKVSLAIPTDLIPNEYLATISYAGNAEHGPSNNTVKVTITKISTWLTIPDVVVPYNTSGKVVATLTDFINGNPIVGVKVKLVLGDIKKTVRTDANGSISVSTKNLAIGDYIASASFAENKIYFGSSAAAKVLVKAQTVLTASDVVVICNSSYKYYVYLKDMEGNAISGVKVNLVLGTINKTVKTDSKGRISASTKNLAIGDYTAFISTEGNEIYAPSSTTANVMVRDKAVLDANDMVTDYNSSSRFYASLKDADGNPIAGVKVNLVLGTINKTVKTDAKGRISASTKNLDVGNYTAVITFAGNNLYDSSKTTANVFVKHISVLSAEDVVATYNVGSRLYATLTDVDGNPIVGVKVNLVLGDINKNVRTDAKGRVSASTKNLDVGNYTAVITFAGDNIYGRSKTTANVLVKTGTSLTANDVVAEYNVSSRLYATLKDTNDNIITGGKVNVVLGSINKTVKTDTKGRISVSTLSLAPGKYTAKISYGGNDAYSKSSTTAKVTVNKIPTTLTAKDIVADQGANTRFYVTLKDADGNPLAGVKVHLVLGDIDKTVKTDASGRISASLKNLAAGSYTAAISCAGTEIYGASSTTASVVIR